MVYLQPKSIMVRMKGLDSAMRITRVRLKNVNICIGPHGAIIMCWYIVIKRNQQETSSRTNLEKIAINT